MKKETKKPAGALGIAKWILVGFGSIFLLLIIISIIVGITSKNSEPSTDYVNAKKLMESASANIESANAVLKSQNFEMGLNKFYSARDDLSKAKVIVNNSSDEKTKSLQTDLNKMINIVDYSAGLISIVKKMKESPTFKEFSYIFTNLLEAQDFCVAKEKMQKIMPDLIEVENILSSYKNPPPRGFRSIGFGFQKLSKINYVS